MKHYGIELPEGSNIQNATVANGPVFPDNPNLGELFTKTTGSPANVLWHYDGTEWVSASNVGGSMPLGPTGAIQYNNDGSFDATTNFRFDEATTTLSIGGSPGEFVIEHDGTDALISNSAGTIILNGTDVVDLALKSITLTAGAGLTGGGDLSTNRTFDIGAGAGITVNANDIAVNTAAVNHNALLNYVADQHVAHTSVVLTAGAGLTGGGDISASRTFDIGAGTGITVNTNDVAIDTSIVPRLAAANSFTNSLSITTADDVIGFRVAGATGKFAVYGHATTLGTVVDSTNAAESAFAPMSLRASAFGMNAPVGITTLDDALTLNVRGATSNIRMFGHLSASTGSYIDAANAAGSANVPLHIKATTLRLEGTTATTINGVNSTDFARQSQTNTFTVNQILETASNAAFTVRDTGGRIGSIAMTNFGPGFIVAANSNHPVTIWTNDIERIRVSNTGAIRFVAYGAGTLVTDASGNVTASSDSRLKNNINPFAAGLAAVLELNPVEFGYTEESGLDQTKTDYVGFIADEVQDIIPEAVGVTPGSPQFLTLNDRPIIAALVNAIKELNDRIEQLEETIEQLQNP